MAADGSAGRTDRRTFYALTFYAVALVTDVLKKKPQIVLRLFCLVRDANLTDKA